MEIAKTRAAKFVRYMVIVKAPDQKRVKLSPKRASYENSPTYYLKKTTTLPGKNCIFRIMEFDFPNENGKPTQFSSLERMMKNLHFDYQAGIIYK